jgi:hypothetical protein
MYLDAAARKLLILMGRLVGLEPDLLIHSLKKATFSPFGSVLISADSLVFRPHL